MRDQAAVPFPFQPAPPAGSKAPAAKQPKAKKAATPKAAKPVKAKKTRKPRPAVLPIGILPALGGMKEAETALLAGIVEHLQKVGKRSRVKIVAALGKVFR
jgi:hypothetical protein